MRKKRDIDEANRAPSRSEAAAAAAAAASDATIIANLLPRDPHTPARTQLRKNYSEEQVGGGDDEDEEEEEEEREGKQKRRRREADEAAYEGKSEDTDDDEEEEKKEVSAPLPAYANFVPPPPPTLDFSIADFRTRGPASFMDADALCTFAQHDKLSEMKGDRFSRQSIALVHSLLIRHHAVPRANLFPPSSPQVTAAIDISKWSYWHELLRATQAQVQSGVASFFYSNKISGVPTESMLSQTKNQHIAWKALFATQLYLLMGDEDTNTIEVRRTERAEQQNEAKCDWQ